MELLGTGAAAPTIVNGLGFTVTRNSAGTYTLTWLEFPGQFHSWDYALRATTQSQLAGFTAVAGAWSTSALTIQVVLYNTAQSATDLAALQWLDMVFNFKMGISAP
jgi:hypothetical protein